MRVRTTHRPSTLELNRPAPGRDGGSPGAARPRDQFERADFGASIGGLLGSTTRVPAKARTLEAVPSSPAAGPAAESRPASVAEAQRAFAARFTELASDPEAFHALMREVYGAGYDAGAAETLRQRAVAGDTSWLPRVELQSAATLQGGHGAYDAANDVVYLSEELLSDPTKMAEVYAEEVGHALDARLNRSDTVGDEGEMFRRLLSGEQLTAAERAEIRAEDDHGVIVVDGRAVEVEFWNPWKAAKKAAKKIGGGLKKAAEKVGAGLDKAADWFVPRLTDAGRGLVTGVRDTVKGIGHGLWEGAQTIANGFGKIFTGDFEGGFKDLGLGLWKASVGSVIDAHLMLGGRVISAIQTLVGLEPPGRGLTADEKAALQQVYGDSLDYGSIRIKEGDAGLLGAGGRPFTHGNTIYVPQGWLDGHPGPDALTELLVHEAGHVWQHQHGGTDYMGEALFAQTFGDGYNIAVALFDGRTWSEMNPEQQAELLQQAYANGWFDEPRDPDLRFVVRLTDAGSDGGFEVAVVDATSADYSDLLGLGYGDFTGSLEAAVAAVRNGFGAP